MEVEEFRVRGKEMVDYICEYLTTVGNKRVTADVEPGYLRPLLPEKPPEKPESWNKIMEDIENKIMPGVTHWQHPRFHAYFPSGNSFPSILGDMLSDAIGCIGFSWAASPACTELETIVLDWLCRAFELPTHFLASRPGGCGGGVIQGSASECILTCMLAARYQALRKLAREAGELTEDKQEEHELRKAAHHLPRLVAYCSREAHSSVEKAASICLVKLKILEPDERGSLRGTTLRLAMEEDVRKGLIPFFVSSILGSTACTSFDNLEEIGQVCKTYLDVWLHVDAAYAGNALICPELRKYMKGLVHADSFNTNPNKWLLTNFDCSCMWVRDRYHLTEAMVVDPLYLQHGWVDEAIDYRHWGIPLSRRFRSLKLWFVLRSYGVEGIRKYIRNHVNLAKQFAEFVCKDTRFELTNEPNLGLVCFRLTCANGDRMSQELLARLNSEGQIHMVPAMVRGKYSIRFCVTSERACPEDILTAWTLIQDYATELLAPPKRVRPPPLARLKSHRYSFTRSVSKELFARTSSRNNLYDGATPIIVPEDEFDFSDPSNDMDEQDEEVFETIDAKMCNASFKD